MNVFFLQGRVRAVVSARTWTDDWSQGALLGAETSMISFTVQTFTVLRSSYKCASSFVHRCTTNADGEVLSTDFDSEQAGTLSHSVADCRLALVN